jgi:hypothetical protein
MNWEHLGILSQSHDADLPHKHRLALIAPRAAAAPTGAALAVRALLAPVLQVVALRQSLAGPGAAPGCGADRRAVCGRTAALTTSASVLDRGSPEDPARHGAWSKIVAHIRLTAHPGQAWSRLSVADLAADRHSL